MYDSLGGVRLGRKVWIAEHSGASVGRGVVSTGDDIVAQIKLKIFQKNDI